MVLSAAVAAGVTGPVKVWPEMFGQGSDEGTPGAFPSTDADMSGFELEEATPASYAADMDALLAASQQLTLREDEPPPFPRLGPGDTEWT